MKCQDCKGNLPEKGRDPVLLRPIYGPCEKCAESHEQGWRDFMDADPKQVPDSGTGSGTT